MKSLWLACLILFSVSTMALGQSNPVPLINNPLVPASAAPGGVGFTLTVNGTGFVSGSVVNWNGSPLATTYLSGSQVTATVPLSDIESAGTASVTVVNPSPGGASNPEFFEVRSPFSESSFGLSSFGSVGSAPLWIIAADVNHDGKLDLISTSNGGLYVSIGNGDGTFQPALNYQTGGNIGTVIASDFNDDGKLDLAAGGGGSVSVLLGNGDGTFQPYQDATGSGAGPWLVAGDFNLDGNQDLATFTFTNGGVDAGVFLGNGDGTFQSSVNSSVPNYGLIVTGDFNGDGKLDLAVTVEGDSAVAILLGNGDGSFQTAVEYPTAAAPLNVVVADLSGDGNLDLATTTIGNENTGMSVVSVLLGSGDGTFQPHVDYPVPIPTFVFGLAVGDLNGDGTPDLTVTSPPGGHSTGLPSLITTYLNRGDGTFRDEGYFATGAFPETVAVGDFNGDGMIDLASANNGDSTISVLPQATAVLSRTKITFPSTKVGSSTTAKVILSNIGASPFTVSKVSLNGNGARSFSQANNCHSALAPGTSCTMKVTFAPTTARKFQGVRLEISDTAVSVRQSVYLNGVASRN